MTTIIDDLAKDHARFRRFLVAFRDDLAKLACREDPDLHQLDLLATYFARFPDELHHKVEDIIYARLEAAARNLRTPLENLRHQHAAISERAQRFAATMKALLNDEALPVREIAAAGDDYVRLLVWHMESEEEVLFRPAQALFTAADWRRVNEDISDLYAIAINYEKAREVLRLEERLDNSLRR
jgi:hemerythrin-like domain-containing protein